MIILGSWNGTININELSEGSPECLNDVSMLLLRMRACNFVCVAKKFGEIDEIRFDETLRTVVK